MSTIFRVVVFFLIYCIQYNELIGNTKIKTEYTTELNDIHKILEPALLEKKKNIPLHSNSVSLISIINKSRWRNSITEAAQILISSTNPEDRKAGWDLANEYGNRISWPEKIIKSITLEPVESVKISAMYTIAKTDRNKLFTIIESMLKNPDVKDSYKHICVKLLESIPLESERVQLWLLASKNNSLRGSCISSFRSVCFSDTAIDVIISWLDDKSIVHEAISADLSEPVELRTFACQSLSNIYNHKEKTKNEIIKRCNITPSKDEIKFFFAAMITLHNLDPKSSYPIEQIKLWYYKLSENRRAFLSFFESEFVESDEISSLIILNSQDPDPKIRCLICKCLSNRSSIDVKLQLNKLIKDEHAGVRLTAVIALAKIAPVSDYKSVRENLLTDSIKFPKEFSLAFESIEDAIIQLALAGQSDEEAISWLKDERTVELKNKCNDALNDLINFVEESYRFIPWKDLE